MLSADITKSRIVQIAAMVMQRNLHPLDAAREIDALRLAMPDPDDPIFNLFRAIASDNDSSPRGEVRDRWSSSALAREDARLKEYVERAQEDIDEACGELIRRFALQ